MGQGGTIGGLIGTGLGMATGIPGAGAIGGKLGAAGGQMIESGINKNKADKNAPPLVDPNVQNLLNEINQKRKSIETGSYFQTGKREVDQNTMAAMEGIKNVSGGNVGGAMAGMLKAQRNGGNQMNSLLGQSEQMNNYFTTLASDLTNRMSSRKLDLQMYDHVSNLANAAQNGKGAFANMMGTIAQNVPLPGQGKTGGTGNAGGGGIVDILTGIMNKRNGNTQVDNTQLTDTSGIDGLSDEQATTAYMSNQDPNIRSQMKELYPHIDFTSMDDEDNTNVSVSPTASAGE